MKINHRDAEPVNLVPEGWTLFVISRDAEAVDGEFKGKKTKRLKWVCIPKKGDFSPINLWTGRDMVDDERCKLTQLAMACEMEPSEVEDTREFAGKEFAGKVVHTERDGNTYANIAAFDTPDRVRPNKKTLKNKSSEEVDPFEDE